MLIIIISVQHYYYTVLSVCRESPVRHYYFHYSNAFGIVPVLGSHRVASRLPDGIQIEITFSNKPIWNNLSPAIVVIRLTTDLPLTFSSRRPNLDLILPNERFNARSPMPF